MTQGPGQDYELPTSGGLYLWLSFDSKRILGAHPESADKAYEDAVARHEDARGYPAYLGITGFPAGANPFVALSGAVNVAYPPTRKERGKKGGKTEEDAPAKGASDPKDGEEAEVTDLPKRAAARTKKSEGESA